MASPQNQHPAAATAAYNPYEWLMRMICWFAAYPYAAYTQIGTASLRARIMANGLAVIISPVVFTMALMTNGAVIVGHSPYLYLLPFVAFTIDRLLVSMSYAQPNGSGWLVVIRVLILSISLAMALLAGLLSESKNLLQRLHAREDASTLMSSEAQNLMGRQNALNTQINANDKELMMRGEIDAERLDALRLRDMECHGRSGIDPRSGTFIKGGRKCGVNAETHRINAEAAEARIAQLDRLEAENKNLSGQRDQIKKDLDKLLVSKRSPPDSPASLGRALKDADFSLVTKILLLILCVLTAEAFAFIMSEVPMPQTLQSSVRFSEEIDQMAMQAWREAEMAKIAKQRTVVRDQAADGLEPLEVTLTPSPYGQGMTRARQDDGARIKEPV